MPRIYHSYWMFTNTQNKPEAKMSICQIGYSSKVYSMQCNNLAPASILHPPSAITGKSST